ncbi:uncharacterized protein G2W53_003733 [Senna tora]|uniref:Uncharacterized protein n=1 Tax=Senna tora TaxID=362788 RepID=A0A834XAN2_9FABA|nr:uncharacterized protein G2W53_003733 [Senna tora]
MGMKTEKTGRNYEQIGEEWEGRTNRQRKTQIINENLHVANAINYGTIGAATIARQYWFVAIDLSQIIHGSGQHPSTRKTSWHPWDAHAQRLADDSSTNIGRTTMISLITNKLHSTLAICLPSRHGRMATHYVAESWTKVCFRVLTLITNYVVESPLVKAKQADVLVLRLGFRVSIVYVVGCDFFIVLGLGFGNVDCVWCGLRLSAAEEFLIVVDLRLRNDEWTWDQLSFDFPVHISKFGNLTPKSLWLHTVCSEGVVCPILKGSLPFWQMLFGVTTRDYPINMVLPPDEDA